MALALAARAVEQVERVLDRDRGTMPLPEAVGRRLGVESWMLTLDAGGRLRAVTLLGTGVAPAPRGEPASAVSTTPSAATAPLERRFPLPATGVLVRLVGEPTATGRQLAELALRSDDAVRAEAVRVAVDAMLRDPGLERAVLGAIAGVDDAALAHALAGVAGDRAADLVSMVAERARGRPLGRRAARVLERLGAP